MGKVTSQTVEVKKSPRSTYILNHSRCGSARIGKLNMVFHKMMEPSDMIRCQVDSEIIFISPLQVPAFAKMKVFTYYFFDSYQNVFDDFDNTIMNYTHEQKSELANGEIVSHSNYTMPYASLSDLSEYISSGLHWLPPITESSSSVPAPPFGNPTSYDNGLYNSLFDYPMQRYMCFSSYEQKKDIAQLCNQFDVPFGALLPLSKDFQQKLVLGSSIMKPSVDNDNTFTWYDFIETDLGTPFLESAQNLPFSRYWRSPLNFAGDSLSLKANAVRNGQTRISILPFKCYQHIFNDWFLDTQKNTPIDLFPSVVSRTLSFPYFRSSALDLFDDTLHFDFFTVRQYSSDANYYMNSIFSLRSPWYAKDYFNTSTNDPTLGTAPYAVGNTILDLRKNSALMRLAEKKALCGNKFIDFIAQHFNYYPPELDISRSIHLGTSVSYVTVSQVLQTSQTTETSAQGERAAVAGSYGRSKGVFFKAPVYGEFMVLQCIKPEIDYYDGIPREMMITDASDFPLPELAQIGFDSILSSEIFVNPIDLNTRNFGYTPRYSWRKTQQNRIYGELTDTLNYWHQSPSLRFGANLNYNFGQIGFDIANLANSPYREIGIASPSFNRIFAMTDVNEDSYVYRHNIQCTLNTCLPTNDMPSL